MSLSLHSFETSNTTPVDVLMGSLPASFDTDEEFAAQLEQLERENEAARAELRGASREAGTHCVYNTATCALLCASR